MTLFLHISVPDNFNQLNLPVNNSKMCSSITLTLFGICLVLGTGLNMLSFTTPAWRHYSLKQAKDSIKNGDYSLGLVSAACGGQQECLDKFNEKEVWEKAAMGFCLMSIIVCWLGIIWAFMTCCLVCCRRTCSMALPIIATAATIFLIIGLMIYGTKSEQNFDIKKIPHSWAEFTSESDFSYSMWLGISAVVFLFITSCFGCLLSKIYGHDYKYKNF